MMLSHGVIQFHEFGFSCCFQPELLIDEVDWLLSFLSIAKSCLFLSASILSLDSLENMVKARAFTKAPPINIVMLAILRAIA